MVLEIPFLKDISVKFKLRYVEINFIFCQLLALAFSYFFRWVLHPRRTSANTRHLAQIIFGIIVAYIAFGWNGLLHMFINSSICYVLMLTMSPSTVQIYVFFVSMVYMSGVHVYHQLGGFGVFNLDYIGPLMMLTMKLGSLAYSIHDGMARDEEHLNDIQKKMLTKEVPRPLEFYSFIFCVSSLLAGPVCFFTEYIEFVEGSKFRKVVRDEKGEIKVVYDDPSSAGAVIRKLIITVLSAVVLVMLVPKVPIWGNVDPVHISERSFLYKIGYLLLSIELAKSKYFLGWVFADAINNAAGIGFAGYDKKGRPKWNGISNIRIIDFETATSLKTLIENWNITGTIWLRHCCYDRVPFQKRLFTFILSAVWHGFYPGYFATFMSAAFFSAVAAKLRYSIRPYFLKSVRTKQLYDVITWFVTHLTLAYFIAPFTFLKVAPTIEYFNSIYWFLHILGLVALIVLPRPKRRVKSTEEKVEKNHNMSNHTHHNGSALNGSAHTLVASDLMKMAVNGEDKKQR
ncbi:lysophospholipid acyltransferase 1-like [Anneissia japonica]|uniref:lysophospholipid acyltransferase 1-like n=1 Tax=Anneissia japonica TaxID=1529436 RepID=UPI0014257FB3|nr:lysophospholipid acyltransferase 1-like [Anneissia japonica]